MVRAAGRYREVFTVEEAQRSRNEAGGTVETWRAIGRVYGSYEAVTYSEQARRGQIGAGLQATVYCRFRPDIVGGMRLRWRGERLLYISSVVEQPGGDDLELTVEEQRP